MKSTFTESGLLCQLAHDDRRAFETIYDQYWDTLYNAAFRRLRNAAQAQDIVQEIFISLWERRKEIKIDNLSAYLQTAVRYRVYNYIARDAAAEVFYEPFEAIAAHPASADALIIEKELQELTNAYIAALPKKRQRIFNLYFEENLTTLEIARRLSISQKTVQNQLGIAMNGLRTHILPVLIFLIVISGILR